MKRFVELQDELKKAGDIINSTADFKLTTKLWDCEYVKWCKSVDAVKAMAEDNDFDTTQALCHWHSYVCSKALIEIFDDLGCSKVDIDKFTTGININGISLIPTVMMLKNSQNSANLATRTGKNDYIRAIYLNDIKFGVKTPKNKLFILIDAKDVIEYRNKKVDFEAIANKAFAFANYCKALEDSNSFNTVDVEGNTVYADLMVI